VLVDSFIISRIAYNILIIKVKIMNALPSKIITLFLCFFFGFCAMATSAFAQGRPEEGQPTGVIVSSIERGAFFDEVEILGTLKANESVNIASTVTERVTNILFEDNITVEKGQLLIEMDMAQELAERAEQQAILEDANRQVKRLTPLARRGTASESALDQSKTNAASAKARLDAIQSRIDQRQIRAPYNGVLGLRNISVGTLAQQGQTLVTLDDIDQMKLDFSVPEVFLSSLKPGITVQATSRAYPDEIFEGQLASIDSRIDPITRSVSARAILDNTGRRLKPGMLMTGKLKKNPRDVLLAPEEALIADGPDSFVFVIAEQGDKTIVNKQKVTLGARSFGKAEILNGLEEGDLIVTHGILKLRPGAQVTITATEKENEPLADLLQQNNKNEQTQPE
jgi:membrane fusion protein (multidrug efflux system)